MERDFYVHIENGVPRSVEEEINRHIETPIARSATWAKISSGNAARLDRSDKANLYALVRHLEARTPHFQQTQAELVAMAADKDSPIPFTDEERLHFEVLRQAPDLAKRMLNKMASTTSWSSEAFQGSRITVLRSPIALRSSSAPSIAIGAPDHEAVARPLPGMIPYQLIAALSPTTLVTLVQGTFEDGFANIEIDEILARTLNRQILGHFAFFDGVRHLVTGREGLTEDMAWAGYSVLSDTPSKIVFYRGT